MIAAFVAAVVFAGVAIRPALAHDNEQPISVTGKARR